jgi:radical SAM superfamily enzyme YgiQ (UPF0313 family)
VKIALPLIHLDDLVFTPLPQLRLKSALVKAGVADPDDVIILEWSRDGSIQAMLDQLVTLQPGIVGFSCYTWSFLAVERLSQAIKAVCPDVLIVWGGPHVSELPRLFFERYPDSVDLIVGWYGEGSFAEIVRLWAQGDPVDFIAYSVPGVWSKNNGEKAALYPKLAELGYPYEFLPETVTRRAGERVWLIETYRNCPFSCSYCLWGQAAKKLDAITETQMIDHVYRAVDQGMRIAMFADAGLGVTRTEDGQSRDKRVFRKFAEDRLLQRAGVQMRAYHFWQTMDDEMLDIFAELIDQGVMGQIDIGIQTFNKNILHDLQRPTNYEKFEAVIQKLHHRGIRFSLDLVLGLPGDNLAGFKESLRKVIACKPERTQSFPLSVLPGTAYDLRRAELGIRTIRGSYRDDAETVVATNSFSYQEIQAALDLEAWMFLWYAEGLFIHSLGMLAEEKGNDALDQLDDLRLWAANGARNLNGLAALYRAKLYDSRSDGRHELEQQLMQVFGSVYRELLQYFQQAGASEAVIDALRDELLRFPKTKQAAQSLHGVDGIEYIPAIDRLRRGAQRYDWQQDPVIGAIVRNRSFYVWKVAA